MDIIPRVILSTSYPQVIHIYMSSNSLTLKNKDVLENRAIKKFHITPTSLTPIGNPTIEDYRGCLNTLKAMETGVQWWIGDLLRYSEETFGEIHSQLCDEKSYSTHNIYQWVAGRIPIEERRTDLSFTHHREVAKLEPKTREKLLDIAEQNKWSVSELRKQKHRALLDAARIQTANEADLSKYLILGDCLDELKKLPNNSIDCVITDPPYGIGFQSNFRVATEKFNKIEGDTVGAPDLLDNACNTLQKKLKDNSHIYIFSNWRVYPEFKKVIEKYFTIKNLLVWVKNNWSMGDLEGNYAEQYELIIFAEKGRRLLIGDRPTNVLEFDRVETLLHPTQKPVDLLEFLIEKSTNEGELVCDPFMGVGSTCLAAKNTNRRFLGIEIEEEWYQIAVSKLNSNGNN